MPELDPGGLAESSHAVVNIREAKAHLSRLVMRAEAGEEIVIAKAGKPVARLVALERPRRKAGTLAGRFRIADDWDSDEINDEIAREFDGRDLSRDRDTG